jgi:hypothetical protein
MAKQYMSVRAVAQAAGVSVQAVYKWIAKGELKAEVVEISEVEKRYHIPRQTADRFLKKKVKGVTAAERIDSARKGPYPSGPRPRKRPARTGHDLLEELRGNGLIGMWKDRDDIGDTLEFARKLRKQASTRHRD